MNDTDKKLLEKMVLMLKCHMPNVKWVAMDVGAQIDASYNRKQFLKDATKLVSKLTKEEN